MSIVARKIYAHLACLGVLIGVAGCGGSGSSNGNQTATPVVSVDWPARSRGFTGLASARSVTIIIRGALAGGADLSFSENRTESTDAYTGAYTAPRPVTVGAHRVDLAFYADVASGGSQVGTATVAAAVKSNGDLVREDGSPLGTVQTSGTISHVSVVGGQTVDAGQSRQLTFAAENGQGQPVAVSAGSAFFSVAEGAANLAVSASGLAQGLALGEAKVVVTVDSIQSAPEVVTVAAGTPVVRSFDANSNAIAYDSTRRLIYATAPANDPLYPSSLVAYDPATGTAVKHLALPSEPYVIALSDDGQYAYVSQNDVGRIVRVDLNSFSVGQTFAIASGRTDTLFQMQVRPQHPTQVAVTHFVGGGSESELTLFDSGVPTAKTDSAVLNLAFGSASKLYGGHFGSMKAYSVDDTGVTVTQQNDNAPGYSYAWMTYADGRLYLNLYGVLDGTSMNILGTFIGRRKNSLMVPDPTGKYAYGLTWDYTNDRVFQVFRKSDYRMETSLTIPNAGASTGSFVQLGPTSFAFNVAGPSKIYIVENVYLP